MSLIDYMTEKFILMNRITTSDGEGGFLTTWTDGAEINVAIVADQSISARVAEKEGVSSTYTLTTTKSTRLQFHDVLRRVSTGAYYRVTSEISDKKSPEISSLDMAQVTAEKWTLTS